MDFISRLCKGDNAVWFVFVALCFISIMEVYSSTSTLVYNTANYYAPIQKHIMFIIIGVVLARLIVYLNIEKFKDLVIVLLPIILIMLYLTLFLGNNVNGASRTIRVASFDIQPSELVKPVLLMWVARCMTFRDEEGYVKKRYFLQIIAATVMVFGGIFTENFSTAVLISFSVYLLMWMGRIRAKWMGYFTLAAISLALLFGGVLYGLYKAGVDVPLGHRISTWEARVERHGSENISDQRKHGNIAVASGGIIGVGVGRSTQREHLSQAYSDFIYAIIVEEIGIIGAAIIILLYLIFFNRCGHIAAAAPPFSAMLVRGIAVLILIQAFFNMAVAVDFAPITGQPLPLVSRGGTSTLVYSLCIGIVLSVSVRSGKIMKSIGYKEDKVKKTIELKDEAL